MKKKVISLGLVLALVAVAVTLTPRSVGYVRAAGDKITLVYVSNWPKLFKVAEQNLDTRGDIKVHEQGTANVNITNTAPIPVTNQSVPTKWEYLVRETPSFQEINDLGAQGWELVSTDWPGGSRKDYNFKRPLN